MSTITIEPNGDGWRVTGPDIAPHTIEPKDIAGVPHWVMRRTDLDHGLSHRTRREFDVKAEIFNLCWAVFGGDVKVTMNNTPPA